MKHKLVVSLAEGLAALCQTKYNLRRGYTMSIEIVEIPELIETGLATNYVFNKNGFFYNVSVLNPGTENAERVVTHRTDVLCVQDFGLKQHLLVQSEDGNRKRIVQDKFGNGLDFKDGSVEIVGKHITFKVWENSEYVTASNHLEFDCYKTGNRVRLAFM